MKRVYLILALVALLATGSLLFAQHTARQAAGPQSRQDYPQTSDWGCPMWNSSAWNYMSTYMHRPWADDGTDGRHGPMGPGVMYNPYYGSSGPAADRDQKTDREAAPIQKPTK